MNEPRRWPLEGVPDWWQFQEALWRNSRARWGSATPPIQVPRTAKCC
jgi:hypothetical protein